MKILLLGTGYVGSELLRSLSIKHSIIALDRSGKYYGKILKDKKINLENIQLIKGDILDMELLDKYISRVDVIINLTGGGGNVACAQNPSKYIDTYVIGTQKVVQNAEKYRIKHFFQFSTISVYPFSNDAISEEAAVKPANLYGALKLASEHILQKSDLNYTILRCANIYGYTNMDPIQEGGAIGNFIKTLFEGKDIRIDGDGKQKIDYVHIKDICSCINMLLNNDLNLRRVYNVGSGNLKTINEIADIILTLGRRHIEKNVNVERIDSQHISFSYPLMLINKIKNEIEWSPKIALKEGIEEMITNYKRIS